MKTTKKLMAIVCTIVMILSLITTTANAARVGDVIGYAQPTDIVATISGYQLESYNVDGYTYICVEDLRYYGFDVVYDNYSRTLSVSRNYNINNINPQSTNPKFWDIGSNNTKRKILYTDIKTYLNGNYVASCNINGQTIIRFDSLEMFRGNFGELKYDDSRREISLTMDYMANNPLAELAINLTDFFKGDSDWKRIVRAKGDMLIIINRSKTIYDDSEANNTASFRQSVQRGDIYNDLAELLNDFRASGYQISSIYVEYFSGRGEKVASVQIY